MRNRRLAAVLVLSFAPAFFAIAPSVDADLSLWFRSLPLWPSYIYWDLVSSYLWLFFIPLVYHLTRRFPLKRGSMIRNGIIHLLAAIFVSVVHLHLNYALGNFLLQLLSYPLSVLDLNEILNLVYRISWRLLIYFVLATVCHSFTFYRRLRQEELKTQKVESELAHARLNALKVRLNPEKIFASFAEIASAMDQDVQKASQLIVSLGDELRGRLRRKQMASSSQPAKLQQREWEDSSGNVIPSFETRYTDRQPEDLDWRWLSAAWIAIG